MNGFNGLKYLIGTEAWITLDLTIINSHKIAVIFEVEQHCVSHFVTKVAGLPEGASSFFAGSHFELGNHFTELNHDKMISCVLNLCSNWQSIVYRINCCEKSHHPLLQAKTVVLLKRHYCCSNHSLWQITDKYR